MDLTIEVIKNVLDDKTHKEILSIVDGWDVPWLKGATTMNKLGEPDKDVQFSHTIYLDHNVTSNLFNVFQPLYDILDVRLFHRIKLTCNLRKNENRILGRYHTDFNNKYNLPHEDIKIAIYYLNSTDGKTLIKENDKVVEVDCEENSVVVFPNSLQHTGTTHTNSDFRYVLNINYV